MHQDLARYIQLGYESIYFPCIARVTILSNLGTIILSTEGDADKHCKKRIIGIPNNRYDTTPLFYEWPQYAYGQSIIL